MGQLRITKKARELFESKISFATTCQPDTVNVIGCPAMAGQIARGICDIERKLLPCASMSLKPVRLRPKF